MSPIYLVLPSASTGERTFSRDRFVQDRIERRQQAEAKTAYHRSASAKALHAFENIEHAVAPLGIEVQHQQAPRLIAQGSLDVVHDLLHDLALEWIEEEQHAVAVRYRIAARIGAHGTQVEALLRGIPVRADVRFHLRAELLRELDANDGPEV